MNTPPTSSPAFAPAPGELTESFDIRELRQLDDHRLAGALATRAGAALLALRRSDVAFDLDPYELGARADRMSDDLIRAALAAVRPDDAVLSEETADSVAHRLGAQRLWIIDPLDGTREYREGRPDFAVHVALWDRDAGLVAGAVALPDIEATLHRSPMCPLLPGPVPPVLVVSRTRAPEWVGEVAAAIGAEVRPLGSVGAKVADIVLGGSSAYVHVGDMSEWDSAAPVAVAEAAGLHISRLDGSPIVFNQETPVTPDLIVCRPELADAILAACARHTS